MLYKCFSCGCVGFNAECRNCESDDPTLTVPLDPEYYEEFQYRSKGFVKDLFKKKKVEKELQQKLDSVLEKYRQFEKPYFVNYVHLAGRASREAPGTGGYSGLQLFHSVLVNLGFDELAELPLLTEKLIRSTAFRFDYDDFAGRIKGHIRKDLASTLQSWIEESGSNFRSTMPMFIYYLWDKKLLGAEIKINEEAPPLMHYDDLKAEIGFAEKIFYNILLKRFRLTLEEFDPSRFVTMYAVDAMSGYDFEDFLGKVLTTIGYDVEVTQRSGDQGADLFAEKFGKKIVIQAKNYIDNVGNAAIQQVLAAKAFYSCDEAMVITNSQFTASAKELADSTEVRLVDRKVLQSYLDEYNRVLMEAAAQEKELKSPSPASVD